MPIPNPPRSMHPIVDDPSGTPSDEYVRWFQSVTNVLNQSLNAAPASASYVLNTVSPLLPNAQVLGNLPTGFAKISTVSGTVTTQSQIRSTDLQTTGVASGSYGSSQTIPSFAVNNEGQLTSATNNQINIGGKFRAYLGTGTQSIPDSTWTKILIDTKSFDTDGIVDTVTNNRITPKTSGYYQINVSVGMNFSGGDTNVQVSIGIYKNGSVVTQGDFRNIIASDSITACASDLVFCNGSTDYLELFIYQASGGSRNARNVSQSTFISGSLLA